MPPERNRRD